MKMIRGMKDNLCFYTNENVDRAEAALMTTIRRFSFEYNVKRYMKSHIIGYDEDTKEVLCFFPLWVIDGKWRKGAREPFFEDVMKNWKEANFEIVEQKEIPGGEYFHVGFDSLFFRLKSLI